GGVGNLLHDGIVNGAKAGSARLAKFAGTKWVDWTGKLSRGLGVIAAGIMAVMDFHEAYKQRMRGNLGIAGMCLISGVAGVGAALLFTAFGAKLLGLTVAAATGIGIILVVIGIAIALLIDFLRTNELQEWMERCLFGTE